jgi:hypothetical protein
MIGQGLQRCVEAALEWRSDYTRGEERVLYYLSRPCSFLEGGAGDQQVVDVQQRAYAVAAKSCRYYGHDARPNSGRARPPKRQCDMGELDDLMIKVAQVRRRLSRRHQWREVWSGADEITSWLQFDELVVDKERQR